MWPLSSLALTSSICSFPELAADFLLSKLVFLVLLLDAKFSISLTSSSGFLVLKFPSLAVSRAIWYAKLMPLKKVQNGCTLLNPWCGKSLWYDLNLIQELLKDFTGFCVNVAILLFKSSARPSSKKLRHNAFLMSVYDVRDHGGNCLSQCEASPKSEYLKSLHRRYFTWTLLALIADTKSSNRSKWSIGCSCGWPWNGVCPTCVKYAGFSSKSCL